MTDRLAHSRMVDGLSRMMSSKAGWIETFSVADRSRPARPAGEIADATELLAVLTQAHADYSIAARREAERQEAA
jgi:hypothetical protein